jgi:hypothetical protein
MARAVHETAQKGLVREALNGSLSKRKEFGLYVDLSDTHEVLADPKDVQKEQAQESILFARSAIVRIIGDEKPVK